MQIGAITKRTSDRLGADGVSTYPVARPALAPRRLLQLVRGLPPASEIAAAFDVDEATARRAAANAVAALAHEHYDLALPLADTPQANPLEWRPYLPVSSKLPVHVRTDGATFVRLVAHGAPSTWILAAFGLCHPPSAVFEAANEDADEELRGQQGADGTPLTKRETSLRMRLLAFLTVQPRKYVDICRALGKAATLAPLSSLLTTGAAIRISRGVYGVAKGPSASPSLPPKPAAFASPPSTHPRQAPPHWKQSATNPALAPAPLGPPPARLGQQGPSELPSPEAPASAASPAIEPASSPQHIGSQLVPITARTAEPRPAHMMNLHQPPMPRFPRPSPRPAPTMPGQYRGSGGPAEATADDLALGVVPDPIAVALFVLGDRARRDRTFGFKLDGHGAGAIQLVNAANRILEGRRERLIAYPGTKTSHIA